MALLRALSKKDWVKGKTIRKYYFIDRISPWATGQAVIFKVTQSVACPTPQSLARVGPYTLFWPWESWAVAFLPLEPHLCSLMIGTYSNFSLMI